MSGHAAAAPPSSVMKSRRLMGTLVKLRAHVTTPLRKNAAVHHSKNCALMSQMGQNEKSRLRDATAGLPSTDGVIARFKRLTAYATTADSVPTWLSKRRLTAISIS
jgi:copper oxidase (laccase) domain-containing protein